MKQGYDLVGNEDGAAEPDQTSQNTRLVSECNTTAKYLLQVVQLCIFDVRESNRLVARMTGLASSRNTSNSPPTDIQEQTEIILSQHLSEGTKRDSDKMRI
ncbi:hypothetical protein PAAG_04695 [Paracoccidioides lutzii Pb01]|uniref:Uncharacterized protein n=1 Tax=Paracoccidioides lutzii (strain ATCC MYA-826 / Pb01) TaxID=502779 RepID=C1H266_PARBA|nr:hypothetical protein PAAG_04695 [Paracoccidioides lutzii Pb01]EEH33646.2 hypothetical protein PAAG_04695 [Paracoccidioides lutzii Pb01]